MTGHLLDIGLRSQKAFMKHNLGELEALVIQAEAGGENPAATCQIGWQKAIVSCAITTQVGD